VQEMKDQKSDAAEMVQVLKENPDRLAQVLVLLRHLKVIDREEKTTDSPEGSKLQAIGSVLLAVTRGSYSGAKFLILAVARGSYSGAKFLILLLFTTLSDFVKMEAEIPKEKIGEYDRMKRSFKEVEVKLKEVEQDVGKMKEEVELICWRCFRFRFRLSCFSCCSAFVVSVQIFRHAQKMYWFSFFFYSFKVSFVNTTLTFILNWRINSGDLFFIVGLG